jgi:hypothetical protein
VAINIPQGLIKTQSQCANLAIVYRQTLIAPQIPTTCKERDVENRLKTGAVHIGSVK